MFNWLRKSQTESNSSTYFINGFCTNCNNWSKWQVPMGITALRFFEGRPCSICGCATVSKSFK